MKTILMSAIALGAMLVAVGFAVQPIQQAAAVHTTIQASSLNVLRLTAAGVTPATAATDRATWTLTTPFVVNSIVATDVVDAGTDCDMAAAAVNTNIATSEIVTEPNPAAYTALAQVRQLVDNTAADSNLGGTTQLRVLTAAALNCAATDSVTIDAFILTNSNTTPAAVLD